MRTWRVDAVRTKDGKVVRSFAVKAKGAGDAAEIIKRANEDAIKLGDEPVYPEPTCLTVELMFEECDWEEIYRRRAK
jgi:hypothetical protein